MRACSSCGYRTTLQPRATGYYCNICIAIGGDKVDQHPSGFEQARFFVPIMGYCTNMLMSAIATRAEAGESIAETAPAVGRKAFIVLSQDGQLVEIQDENGTALELSNGHFSPVAGTDFKKFGVVLS
jgi:hypothetical protein